MSDPAINHKGWHLSACERHGDDDPAGDGCNPNCPRSLHERVERLDQRVHDQTHARIHAELAIESALKDIERGRQYDAEATLRRALENGSSDTSDGS